MRVRAPAPCPARAFRRGGRSGDHPNSYWQSSSHPRITLLTSAALPSLRRSPNQSPGYRHVAAGGRDDHAGRTVSECRLRHTPISRSRVGAECVRAAAIGRPSGPVKDWTTLAGVIGTGSRLLPPLSSSYARLPLLASALMPQSASCRVRIESSSIPTSRVKSRASRKLDVGRHGFGRQSSSQKWLAKGWNGPEGLRSHGSPVMSRLLYQAELRAPTQIVAYGV